MSEPYVLAVDFGGTKAGLAAIDRSGAVLAGERLAMHAERGAEQAIVRTIDAARALVTDAGAGALLASGVASPGIVLPDGVLLAPNVPGWSTVRLQARFEEALGVPAVCATDVKAATLAEARWGRLQDVQTGIHLNLGTGIAVGVVVDGTVLTGAHGAAGEIGYYLRSPSDRVGPHEGFAPLEEHVGGKAIGERGRAVGGDGDAASVFALARTDPAARAFVDATVADLAVHIANTAILVDPQRITVGGGMAEVADVLLPAIADVLDRAVPFPPQLVTARFTQDGPLVGAAALAWDSLR
ncbi:ROK family protein [Pseudonocardia sp. TRM90224]|uniref:ROK family protein n=1 Tax=Pseudonocardia sp. TRM90224 TaxID=2812678 RepID=UPI001E53B2E5|nr:ROK family protein [Pseudonocardia sp. TRM90224]